MPRSNNVGQRGRRALSAPLLSRTPGNQEISIDKKGKKETQTAPTSSPKEPPLLNDEHLTNRGGKIKGTQERSDLSQQALSARPDEPFNIHPPPLNPLQSDLSQQALSAQQSVAVNTHDIILDWLQTLPQPDNTPDHSATPLSALSDLLSSFQTAMADQTAMAESQGLTASTFSNASDSEQQQLQGLLAALQNMILSNASDTASSADQHPPTLLSGNDSGTASSASDSELTPQQLQGLLAALQNQIIPNDSDTASSADQQPPTLLSGNDSGTASSASDSELTPQQLQGLLAALQNMTN
ncbi:MAG: hypothetical protein F6K65_39600, partial [Moorea sp. SIO3C2]|nr:hypothetical protein [Moorena sp. SIO3C2]